MSGLIVGFVLICRLAGPIIQSTIDAKPVENQAVVVVVVEPAVVVRVFQVVQNRLIGLRLECKKQERVLPGYSKNKVLLFHLFQERSFGDWSEIFITYIYFIYLCIVPPGTLIIHTIYKLLVLL